MTAQRRRLLSVDDPLEPRDPPAPARAGRIEQGGLRALYVRLAPAEYDAVARAAFELKVHKRELIAALIRHHVDPHTPDGLAALRQLLGGHGDSPPDASPDHAQDEQSDIPQAP